MYGNRATKDPELPKQTKERKIRGTIAPDITCTLWYWYKNRSIGQNREPENKAKLHSQLIYNKGDRNVQREKDSFLNIHAGKKWIALWKKIRPDYFLIPYTKINTK